MQAIQTKYLPCSNVRGSRIKAKCDRGSIVIDYPHELSGDKCHIAAADALIAKFVAEDENRYGTNRNPWANRRVCGGLPDGTYAHVFVDLYPTDALVRFQSEEDRNILAKYMDRAKTTEGTVAPLWNGLLCSALKQATLA